MKLLVPVKGSIQNPTFSPNGKSFLFNRFRHSYNSEAGADLYIADLHDRERLTLVTSGDLEGANNWSAPGFHTTWNNGLIVFSTDHGGRQWPASISPDGSGFKKLAEWGTDIIGLAPSMSPSGQEIVFEVRARDKRDAPGAIVVAATGWMAGQEPAHRQIGQGSKPSWSPDGQSIAWEDQGRIIYHDIRSAQERAVGPADKPFWTPTWHAQPDRLLVGGSDALYQITTTGSLHVAFAVEHDRTRWLGNASWSPDFNGKHRRLMCEASDRDNPDGGPGTFLEIY